MQAIEEYEHEGISVKIYQDEDRESPREWDNVGTMVCFHDWYQLGDQDHEFGTSEDYDSWEGLKKAILRKHRNAIILPLYLYDHSGLRIKVGSFYGLLPQGHAEFDSGQVGYIFASCATIRKEYGRAKDAREKAEAYLRGEVETYDQYLVGDVYGYVVDEDGENQDSCWGCYGLDECKDEANAVAAGIAKRTQSLTLPLEVAA